MRARITRRYADAVAIDWKSAAAALKPAGEQTWQTAGPDQAEANARWRSALAFIRAVSLIRRSSSRSASYSSNTPK